MYDGMRFAGVPKYVQCADDDMKNFFECRDITADAVAGFLGAGPAVEEVAGFGPERFSRAVTG